MPPVRRSPAPGRILPLFIILVPLVLAGCSAPGEDAGAAHAAVILANWTRDSFAFDVVFDIEDPPAVLVIELRSLDRPDDVLAFGREALVVEGARARLSADVDQVPSAFVLVARSGDRELARRTFHVEDAAPDLLAGPAGTRVYAFSIEETSARGNRTLVDGILTADAAASRLHYEGSGSLVVVGDLRIEADLIEFRRVEEEGRRVEEHVRFAGAWSGVAGNGTVLGGVDFVEREATTNRTGAPVDAYRLRDVLLLEGIAGGSRVEVAQVGWKWEDSGTGRVTRAEYDVYRNLTSSTGEVRRSAASETRFPDEGKPPRLQHVAFTGPAPRKPEAGDRFMLESDEGLRLMFEATPGDPVDVEGKAIRSVLLAGTLAGEGASGSVVIVIFAESGRAGSVHHLERDLVWRGERVRSEFVRSFD